MSQKELRTVRRKELSLKWAEQSQVGLGRVSTKEGNNKMGCDSRDEQMTEHHNCRAICNIRGKDLELIGIGQVEI